MPPIRPKLSITLPRNFTFHYTDGAGPKTPELGEDNEPQQPSPPRQLRLRTRRRRGPLFDPASELSSTATFPRDVPIPTIETPEPLLSPSTFAQGPASAPLDDVLAPMPTRRRFFSPPKTPLAQVHSSFDKTQTEKPEWSQRGDVDPADSISRPASACSVFSDSSETSSSSSASFPSNGGSCTSPDSDAPDPLAFPTTVAKGKQRLQAGPSEQALLPRPKRGRTSRHKAWTQEMDAHLWTTYLLYLQDPTVTPFRTSHGSAPPLGVCCRVARTARKSWRGPKSSLNPPVGGAGLPADATGKQVLRDVNDEANAVRRGGSPDTVTGYKSGSATPTGRSPTADMPQIKWPTSESATRRRLRFLCKRKSTPSIRQHRLLQSRSPTPFQRLRPAGPREQPSFSTRDMAFSLTASTAASMQPGGALASLARGDHETQGRSDQWPALAVGPAPHETHPHLGLGIGGLEGANTFPRLGSPFPGRSRPSLFQSSHLRPPSPPRTQSDGATIAGPSLKSPVQLTAPLPFPSALKRRAQHQLEDELSPGGTDMQRNLFEELFGAPADSSHRRVRSRGFSLGDISEGSRLSSLVTPPTIYDQMDSSEFANASAFDADQATAPPEAERTRLGSPFGGDGMARGHGGVTGEQSSSSQQLQHADRSLHLPACLFDQAPSIEERLGGLDRDEASRKRMRG
ncbi:MAG: hypothetical protein M1832_001489 [Thelocarpon impressellum]|nr:MAG: hypothetical protein M1832_001489 [Thelocarpon impressellum]